MLNMKNMTVCICFINYNECITLFINPSLQLKSQNFDNMSRCEHGDPITHFCINELCTWRQVAGCLNCMKKYHPHTHNFDINSKEHVLTLQDLEGFVKTFYVAPQIKPKSRILQQAIYNYFIIIKNQITSSLDLILRNITNKISYPYLSSEGQLNIYRKVKNKQYKKINKKQLKNFNTFVSTQTKQIIEQKQNKLYMNQVEQLDEFLRKYQQVFSMYEKIIEVYDNTFSVQKSFYSKVCDLCQTIKFQNKNPKKSEQKTNISQLSNQKSKKNLQKIRNNTQTKNKQINKNQNYNSSSAIPKTTKDRKVSIDFTMTGGIDINKFKSTNSNNQNFDENQKQIIEKKKKLFQMMSNPTSKNQSTRKQQKKSINVSENKVIQRKEQIEQNKQQKKLINKHSSLDSQIKPKQQLQIQKKQAQIDLNQEIDMQSLQAKQNEKHKQQKQSHRLFDDLMQMGINLPQIIMHTILPRQASRQKLYEDTKDVKQRKITIPVKKFQEQQQITSPILKKKRQNKLEKSQNQQSNKDNMTGRINLFDNKDNDTIKQQTQSQNQTKKGMQTPKKNEDDDKLLLKDKQADSLALLIESLHLPAQKAIPLLQASIKFAHNNLSAAQYLSYLYLQIQKPKNCLELCNKILQQIQDSSQINQLSVHISNNKAAALNMLGRYSESIGILQRCISYLKRDIYYKNLGDAYFSIAIYQKAIFNYQNALKMNNKMQQAYYNLAVCYYMQDHMNEAKLNVQNALKLNPKNQDYIRLSREIILKIPL